MMNGDGEYQAGDAVMESKDFGMPETEDGVPFLQMQSAGDLNAPEDSGAAEDEDSFCIPDEEVPAAIEAILFAYGEAVTVERIAELIGKDKEKTASAVRNLMNEMRNSGRRGICIRQVEDSFVLSTKPEMRRVMERLFMPKNRPPMSQAAYETLAIIAYNQPVTRSQVEAVRGVDSDSIIARLAEKELIRECGTLDAPGRPALFETTGKFLREFGLSSVRELPPMDMIMYRTLRDIESSVAEAAGTRTDSQLTIEQLVSASVPPSAGTEDKAAHGRTADREVSPSSLIDKKDVMDISEAFFGEEKE